MATGITLAGARSDRSGVLSLTLTALGAPQSELPTLETWAHYEGGTARNNPLNTCWIEPGSWRYNAVGVRQYRTPEQGADAIARTLTNGGYPEIVTLLRDGIPITSPLWHTAIVRREISRWGTRNLARALT